VIGQVKFSKYSKLKEAGRSFNEDLCNSKGYRNPDFLQHAVTHENIDQIGSCFRPDIFNPHGYEKIDFLMPWVWTLHFDILLLASCVVFLSIIGFAIE
jgi:hypothetical protein